MIEHGRVSERERWGLRGSSRRSRLALASTAALAVMLAPSFAAAKQPRESPGYGDPYRHGIVVEASVGVALCQPGMIFVGRCSGQVPGVGLRLGGGWRFGHHLQLGAAWVRQAHRPGGFVSGTNDGGVLAVRGIIPLPTREGAASRVDLGFELGLGYSQRTFVTSGQPSTMRSTGLLARPAIVLDGWILADFALGLEIAPHFNLHWDYCVDTVCEARPGDWVPSPFDRRWVDGLTVSLRLSGLVFPRW